MKVEDLLNEITDKIGLSGKMRDKLPITDVEYITTGMVSRMVNMYNLDAIIAVDYDPRTSVTLDFSKRCKTGIPYSARHPRQRLNAAKKAVIYNRFIILNTPLRKYYHVRCRRCGLQVSANSCAGLRCRG